MVDQLRDLLHDLLGPLDELQELLRRETTALIEGQDDAIVQLATDKQTALGQLADGTKRLDALLRRQGFTPDAGGLAACVRETRASEGLETMYDEVIRVLGRCRVHNQTNGAVLERKRSALERALRVLFDQEATPDRYHATGRLDGFGAHRTIGEA
ncbi:MAG: flagellar protein FlgN [Chromatiaceae bacterium]